MGRGRKGLSTKLHLALSTGGIQSACQRVDMKVFSKLWELGKWSGIRYVMADKGYDSSVVRTPIKKAKRIPVIPMPFFQAFKIFINPITAHVLL